MIQLGPTKRRDMYNKGIVYQFSILVTDAELSTYWVDLATDITLLQKDETGPIYAYERRRAPYSVGQWKITYTGVNSIENFNVSIVPSKKNKSYSSGEFQFTPDMFGVHKAQASEVLEANGGVGSSTSARLNVSETAAHLGDWIYNNATSSSAGSANFAACPLDISTILPADLNFLLTYPCPTVIYTVVYPDSSQSTDDYFDWNGTNGPFPSSLAPSSIATGLWKARKAKSETVQRGSTTSQYVVRIMETGPKYKTNYYKWDVVKFPAWTWS